MLIMFIDIDSHSSLPHIFVLEKQYYFAAAFCSRALHNCTDMQQTSSSCPNPRNARCRGEHKGSETATFSVLFRQPREGRYSCYMNSRQKLKELSQKRGNKVFREAHTKYTASNTGMIEERKWIKILWTVVSKIKKMLTALGM